MNPLHHRGRRKATALPLNKLLAEEEWIVFTDASKDKGTTRATAAVTNTKELLTCASAEVKDVEEAEELAIALALTVPGTTKVVTDLQQDYRSFQSGWVSRLALWALRDKEPPKGQIEVVWVLAHSAVDGNEFAHQQVRALTYRATALEEAKSEPMLTYSEIVTYYREDRRRLPAPHSKLTKDNQTIHRQPNSVRVFYAPLTSQPHVPMPIPRSLHSVSTIKHCPAHNGKV